MGHLWVDAELWYAPSPFNITPMAILYMSPAYVRVLPDLMPVHLALLQHLGAEQGLLLGKLPVWVQRTLPAARCTKGPMPSDTACCTTFVAMCVALASITQPETHAGHISQANCSAAV